MYPYYSQSCYTDYSICSEFLRKKNLLSFAKRNKFNLTKTATNIKGKILVTKALPENNVSTKTEYLSYEIRYLSILLQKVAKRLFWVSLGISNVEEKLDVLYKEIERRNLLYKVKEYNIRLNEEDNDVNMKGCVL